MLLFSGMMAWMFLTPWTSTVFTTLLLQWWHMRVVRNIRSSYNKRQASLVPTLVSLLEWKRPGESLQPPHVKSIWQWWILTLIGKCPGRRVSEAIAQLNPKYTLFFNSEFLILRRKKNERVHSKVTVYQLPDLKHIAPLLLNRIDLKACISLAANDILIFLDDLSHAYLISNSWTALSDENWITHYHSRYEIFMDEVKPQDLSMSFLREFMSLPTSYFSAGGPLKYR